MFIKEFPGLFQVSEYDWFCSSSLLDLGVAQGPEGRDIMLDSRKPSTQGLRDGTGLFKVHSQTFPWIQNEIGAFLPVFTDMEIV